MDLEVLDALEAVGYDGIKVDDANIQSILEDTVAFSKILAWIVHEMKVVSKLEEGVKEIKNVNEELVSFHMDLSSLLKELGCTYSRLNTGNVGERFNSAEQRLLVLTFLLSELQSRRMLHVGLSQAQSALRESENAKNLREICQTLGLSKPPSTIDTKTLFTKLEEILSQIQSKIKPTNISYKPLFTGVLSPKQWTELNVINKELKQEYQLRREMLLKRLDVTIQSFHWADKLEAKKVIMAELFREHRTNLSEIPNIKISDVLAARTDLLFNDKTSAASVRERTKSAINDFIIGKVPDRGGRPDEAIPPPPEMPPWQQRSGPPGASGSKGWIPNQQRGGQGPGGRGRGQGHSGHGYQQQGHSQPQYHQQGYSQPQYQQADYGQQGYQGGGHGRGGGYQQRGGRGGSRVQGGWSHY